MNVTTQNAAPTFSAQCWITGASGFTDSDPTSVAPSANRIITPLPYVFMADMGRPAGLIGCTLLSAFLADGTSATLRAWMFDDVAGGWTAISTALPLTFAGTNDAEVRASTMQGCKFFMQVTANTGVTKIAFMIR